MAKSVSPDKGKTVQWYFEEKLSDWQQTVAGQLHEIVLANSPEAVHSVKWGQAVYSSPEGPMIFMKGNKNHLTFGFWRGAEMANDAGLLEGTGEKMRHIKIKAIDGYDAGVIAGYVKQAIQLNAEKGDPTKRS